MTPKKAVSNNIFFNLFFFFKQKTAYEIKECDWSSDVCSSDLGKPNQEGAEFCLFENGMCNEGKNIDQ